MSTDEQAIREVVATWHRATAAGEVETVLTLMAEDVVFFVAGHPPMRARSASERGLRSLLSQHRIESASDVQEIEISGDLACCWNVLTVRVTPIAGGNTAVRTGNALSILRKQANGSWIGRARRKHVVGGIVTPHSASGLTYDVDRVGGAEIAIVNG